MDKKVLFDYMDKQKKEREERRAKQKAGNN
jgi:hypothetical protein